MSYKRFNGKCQNNKRTKLNSRNIILISLILCVMTGCNTGIIHADTFAVLADAETSVSVICPDCAKITPIGDYLLNYLKERTDKVNVKLLHALPERPLGSQFILVDEKTLPGLKQNIALNFASDAHPDSFILNVQDNDKYTNVYLFGKTPAGVRQAVSRFMQKLRNDGKTLSIKAGREEKSPFINTRLVMIAPTARRQIKLGSRFEDANHEIWDTKRLRSYPQLFLQFGFSGIQIFEGRGYGSISGEYLVKAQNAIKTLALGAKDYDMFVSLDQWGDCPFVEGKALCWELPEERKILEEFFTDLANRYSPLVDHVYIHVGDPGGATHGGCTLFKTPQLLATGILNIFSRQNPNVQACISTWANPVFWKHSPVQVDLSNYPAWCRGHADKMPFGQPIPDGAQFLDDTWMPKKMGIALMRYFNQAQADILEASGRPVDVWGWYIGDMEMHNNITLNMTNIDKYYRDLPARASEQIRVQTIELCFHSWPQIINTYVGAQKMWNPKRPLVEIEQEFCTAAFGPQNTKAMHALYKACENPWDYDVWGSPLQHIPRPADLSTAEGNARMKALLIQAETIKFPKEWQPNFAFPVPVQKYVEMLKARLGLTLHYSEAKYKIDQLRHKAAGANADKIEKIKQHAIDSLPYLLIDPLHPANSETAKRPGYKLPTWADLINNF